MHVFASAAVKLMVHHRRLRQGEMESGGYPATSAPPPTCERENLDSRLRGNDERGLWE